MMNNCAFSVLVLMLSSSNAGLNSINQQTFAGYILAVIINAIQETGSCDPIVLEVFRLELTNLSGKAVWSNSSELVEFNELYNVCGKNKIILTNEVEFVPSNVKKSLNGKRGSTFVEAHNWVPSIYDLANGTLSEELCSKHRITAVVLHKDDHFFIIIIDKGGIFLIDGKGKRIDEFKAESTLRQLTIEQFLESCATHCAFYLFEEIPFVSENAQCVLLPPDQLVEVAWVPSPPPPLPCEQVAWIPSPPQPQYAQVNRALPSLHTQSDITVSGTKWSCNGSDFSGKVETMPHPTYPQVLMEVYFYKTVAKTTLKDLVDFLNFIKSIQ